MKRSKGRREMEGSSLRRTVSILLTLVLLGSLGALGFRTLQYRAGEKVYQEAEELVKLPDLENIQTPTLPPAVPAEPVEETGGEEPAQSVEALPQEPAPVYVDPYAQALADMDFVALREQNTDVLGWILIPNTKISYPLVQGEDNDYYLNHTWRKSRSVVGAIFMEQQSSPDLMDFNTIIYGHRMNNRSMFGRLLDYKEESYWQAHPRFYITDDSGTHTYEIFAAYEAAVRSTPYCIRFASDTEKQIFIDYSLEHSVVNTGIVPRVTDRIVTLSTCTGNGHATRWIVQGVEWVETAEEPPVEELPGEEIAVQELPAEEEGGGEVLQTEEIVPAPEGGENPSSQEPQAQETQSES